MFGLGTWSKKKAVCFCQNHYMIRFDLGNTKQADKMHFTTDLNKSVCLESGLESESTNLVFP